jgi:hypothetical protein
MAPGCQSLSAPSRTSGGGGGGAKFKQLDGEGGAMFPQGPKETGGSRGSQIGQRGTAKSPNKHEIVLNGGPFSCRAGLRHKAMASPPLTPNKRPPPRAPPASGFRGCPLVLPVQLPTPSQHGRRLPRPFSSKTHEKKKEIRKGSKKKKEGEATVFFRQSFLSQ